MVDLELKRVPGERRLYELAGVGTLRLRGIVSPAAVARRRMGRRGDGPSSILVARHSAVDAAGATVGTFSPRVLRRGGTLVWAGRELSLRPASQWRERYALVTGEQELAVFEGKGWGSSPVKVRLDDGAAVDPALLLFTAFIVRGLAEDASGAAGAGAATAATG